MYKRQGWTLTRVLWKVLTKKKKYDAVISADGKMSHILRLAGALRGIKVFSLGPDGKLRNAYGRDLSMDDAARLAGYLRKKK